MFLVSREDNKLERIVATSFADLRLRERSHLQEWIANQPDVFGEELLIIQKEFDGFEDTRERLDLLALDKDGALVVIENKLDDAGRDVVWQALKYTAYCSTLTKLQIIDIYQRYLDRYGVGGDAASRICEFLGEDGIDEVVVNVGNGQRIILVAAHFRKEVTSTALWLISHGVDVRCFKASAYIVRDELLLNLSPIIPPPESADFMIGMSSKEAEEKAAAGAQKTRHQIRLDFWAMALEALRSDGVTLFQNISPTRDHWLSAGSGVRLRTH